MVPIVLPVFGVRAFRCTPFFRRSVQLGAIGDAAGAGRMAPLLAPLAPLLSPRFALKSGQRSGVNKNVISACFETRGTPLNFFSPPTHWVTQCRNAGPTSSNSPHCRVLGSHDLPLSLALHVNVNEANNARSLRAGARGLSRSGGMQAPSLKSPI